MAFGTGLHPTTRLCLVGVERLADAGRLAGATVVDVGCGSGILSVAAARFGAAHVLGVDIDPIAVEATVANARRNHVARRVRARWFPADAGGPFDVVLANSSRTARPPGGPPGATRPVAAARERHPWTASRRFAERWRRPAST
jgi:ribosomal protein L11 methylase PrmA